MGDDKKLLKDLYKATQTEEDVLNDPDIAHLFIHHNKVIGTHLLPGLKVITKEMDDGVEIDMTIQEGAAFKKTVHLCFGMFPEKGVQKIIMNVNAEKKSKIFILAHCTFPNAIDVKHIMNAQINIGEDAEYNYFERHIHGDKGGMKVFPKAVVKLDKKAIFRTEFELLKGRVGFLDIDYETTCKENSVMEMNARINGIENDVIKIKEKGYLVGKSARGVLTSRVALRGSAKAEIYNKLIATAPFARGHVDCKEIVQDNAIATAIPIVEVSNPKAHITHEAAIGSVDSKQLETLMSRGLSEDEAVELIIHGLLS